MTFLVDSTLAAFSSVGEALTDAERKGDLEGRPKGEGGGGEGGLGELRWEAACKALLEVDVDGKRMARALGLANAGLADVERLLSFSSAAKAAAAAESSSPSSYAAPGPVALAVELHPLLPQRKLVGVCRRTGVALIALNPTGNGSGNGNGNGNGASSSCLGTEALLENAAVAAAAAAEGRSPREVRFFFSLLSLLLGTCIKEKNTMKEKARRRRRSCSYHHRVGELAEQRR